MNYGLFDELINGSNSLSRLKSLHVTVRATMTPPCSRYKHLFVNTSEESSAKCFIPAIAAMRLRSMPQCQSCYLPPVLRVKEGITVFYHLSCHFKCSIHVPVYSYRIYIASRFVFCL